MNNSRVGQGGRESAIRVTDLSSAMRLLGDIVGSYGRLTFGACAVSCQWLVKSMRMYGAHQEGEDVSNTCDDQDTI